MSFDLDLRTIVVLLLLTTILMATILWVGARDDRGNGLGKWVLGLGLIAAGWQLLSLRGLLPPVLSVALADAAFLGGLCAQIGGLLEFGRRRPPRELVAPAPLLFLVLLPIRDQFIAYTLVTSLMLAVPLLALSALSWRLGDSAARWPMAFLYLLGGILLVVRALDIWLAPAGRSDIFHSQLLDSVTFVTHFAMTITGSFGFLEMRRQRAEASIRHLAMYDGLTELLNHRAFLGLAERELERARRMQAPFALLMIDLDRFKHINDTYGHLIGDRVLATIAETAKNTLRGVDLIGRYGGEEFCALIPNAGLQQARTVAERLRLAVEATPIADVEQCVTASIGVAVCTDPDNDSLDALIERADQAHYRAKNGGRNRVEIGT